jgi:hypothetical protein
MYKLSINDAKNNIMFHVLFSYAECYFAMWRYAECHYDE